MDRAVGAEDRDLVGELGRVGRERRDDDVPPGRHLLVRLEALADAAPVARPRLLVVDVDRRLDHLIRAEDGEQPHVDRALERVLMLSEGLSVDTQSVT